MLTVLTRKPEEDARSLKHVLRIRIVVNNSWDAAIGIDLEERRRLLLVLGKAQWDHIVAEVFLGFVGVRFAELFEHDADFVSIRCTGCV